MEKMTQRDYFNAIIAMAKGEPAQVPADEIVAFAEGRIDALNRKSENRKPTKAQTENEALKAVIYDALVAFGEPKTVTEVIKGTDALVGLSTQKVSALLTLMQKAGKVDKVVDKRVTRYFAVTAE